MSLPLSPPRTPSSRSRPQSSRMSSAKNLKLDESNYLYKNIAYEDHKYWQNRFLFGPEYHYFITQMVFY